MGRAQVSYNLKPGVFLTFSILEDNLNLLTDMRQVYTVSDTLQKREFVNKVFDSNLYYENGIYRTPAMLGLLSHNHLKMSEKRLLIYEKKRGFLMKTLSAEGEGFEPPDLLQSTVFKTAAFDHSAILPGAKLDKQRNIQKVFFNRRIFTPYTALSYALNGWLRPASGAIIFFTHNCAFLLPGSSPEEC
jgi:hypothetical protein